MLEKSTSSVEDGAFSVELLPAETAGLRVGVYSHQWRIIDAEGDVGIARGLTDVQRADLS